MTLGPAPAPTPADDAAWHRVLAVPSRVDILGHLRDADDRVTVQQVAAEVGLGVSTARDHLAALVTAGLVERTVERRTTRGRPHTLYRAAADPAGGAQWLLHQLSRLLLDGYGRPLDAPEAVAEHAAATLPSPRTTPGAEVVPGAGRARDADRARTRQLAALHAHLFRLGFDPESGPGGGTIRLRRCPVLDLARERSEVVCAMHLGLARGVLTRMGGPVTATALVPFAVRGACVLHLHPG